MTKVQRTTARFLARGRHEDREMMMHRSAIDDVVEPTKFLASL